MGNLSIDVWQVLTVFGILFFAWMAFVFKRRLFVAAEKKINIYTATFLEKVLSILILFVSSMFLLRTLGIDVLPLLTVSGVGAAILGFASKDVVANFFGGVMIYVTRPFALKDQIEIANRSISGQVEEIGWYHTVVRDAQKKLVYIPNCVFPTEVVINHTRMTHRRFCEMIRVRVLSSESAADFSKKILNVLRSHKDVDQKESIIVQISSMRFKVVIFEVSAYIKQTDYLVFLKVKEEILLSLYKAAFEKGASIQPMSELGKALKTPSIP